MDSLQYLNGLAVVWLIFDGCRCRLVVRPKTKHFVKELFDTRGKWSLRVASGSEWNSCDHGVRVFMQPCSLVQLCHELAGKNDGQVGNKRYFQCDADRGIFLRPRAIVKSLVSYFVDHIDGLEYYRKLSAQMAESAAQVCCATIFFDSLQLELDFAFVFAGCSKKT